MGEPVRVTEVRFSAAQAAEKASGLIGWITCVANGSLRLDGIALRRTREGRITLSFPSRRDRAGCEHAYVRPLDDAVRREIEEQVFRALGFGQEAAER